MLKVSPRKGSPYWQITGTVKTSKGPHRVRESSGTTDKAAAEAEANRIEARIRTEDHLGPQATTTFGEAADLYTADKEREEEAPASHYLANIIVKVGHKRLAEFSPGEVQDIAKAIHPKASAATRNRHGIVPFMAVYNYAVKRKLAPPMVVERFEEKKPKTKSIDGGWITKVRAKMTDVHARAMCRLMFETGMRLGTALGLEPAMFDHAECVLTVPAALLKNDEDHEFVLSQSLADEIASLPPISEINAAKAASSRVGQRRNEKLLFGFTVATGYYKHLKKACAAAGVPYVPPHQSGRHSFATKMIVEDNVDPVTVAAIGGWKDVPALMKNYPHEKRAKMRSVVERSFGDAGPQKLKVVK